MPNPLAPGVYIQEVPFASHSILGGPASVVGFVAVTGRGPLLGPLTSFADFDRVAPPNLGVNLPLVVAGFFFSGGQICFISQIAPGDPLEGTNDGARGDGAAEAPFTPTLPCQRARFPR